MSDEFNKSDPTLGGLALQTGGRSAMKDVVAGQQEVLQDSAKNPEGKETVDNSSQYQAANPTEDNAPAEESSGGDADGE